VLVTSNRAIAGNDLDEVTVLRIPGLPPTTSGNRPQHPPEHIPLESGNLSLAAVNVGSYSENILLVDKQLPGPDPVRGPVPEQSIIENAFKPQCSPAAPQQAEPEKLGEPDAEERRKEVPHSRSLRDRIASFFTGNRGKK
jgi:hypothetical protein